MSNSSKFTSAELKLLKQLKKRDKSSVFGYIHESELALCLCDIPMMIFYLCLAYYGESEYFCTSNNINDPRISNNHMTITKIIEDGCWYYSYCNTLIDSTCNKMIKWTFKLNVVKRNERIIFLIAPSLKSNEVRKRTAKYNPYEPSHDPVGGQQYVFDNWGTVKIFDYFWNKKPTRRKWDNNATVSIYLDLSGKNMFIGRIGLKINDSNIDWIINEVKKDDDIQYFLHVSLLLQKGSSITLLDFDMN